MPRGGSFILDIFYNFIISKKSKKKLLALLFCLSLIILGIGSGIFCIGITEFKVISNYGEVIENEIIIPWNDKLIISSYYNVNYIEINNNDIRIVYTYYIYYDLNIEEYNNVIHFNGILTYKDEMEAIRNYIEDIKNKNINIVDYSNFSINIYTSSENIDMLRSNSLKYQSN